MVRSSSKDTSSSAVGNADRTLPTMHLEDRVSSVSGVSPKRAQALGKMGVSTVRDLLTLFPRRYVDLSKVETIRTATIGESCTIRGRIHEMKLKRPKPKLALVEITLVDETGVMMVTAFRQPWLMDTLSQDMHIAVAGKIEFDYGFKRMTNPFIEPLDGANSSANASADGFIIPVHPACAEISTAWMRRLVGNALEEADGMEDFMPLPLREKHCLMSRHNALRSIHFPLTMDDMRLAHRRLVYEEVLLLELSLMLEGARAEGDAAHLSDQHVPVAHMTDGPAVLKLFEVMPFALTQDQMQAVSEILANMAKPTCANHLLLGDVGTGKTAVTAFALAAAADSGNQAVMMAPTEVLARQYAQSLGSLFDQVGFSWAFLSGATSASERADILQRLAAGEIQVLFGTHAVIEPDVAFCACSLCVIDEQQRFGVEQRARLLGKGSAPDALYLTATPIPRSLALALFGNLSLSYLRQRPHAGAQRTTKVLTRGESSTAYDAAREALERGEQVYVVCPLVGLTTEERDTRAQRTKEDQEDHYEFSCITIEGESDFARENIAAASSMAKRLQDTVFYDFNVALLHGKLSNAEKQKTMDDFRRGDVQVLVATTVIEVGVDVPNATVIIVEDADRFGLSQLHQLRGRVGRGTLPSQVFLISNAQTPVALDRLGAMERTDDGFELAAYDLSLRREGDILGNRQHGASSLKLVNVIRDSAVIEAAHADAAEILQDDPRLECLQHRALAREVRMMRGNREVMGG